MATAKHPLLLATAAVHGLLSLGHTMKGFELFQHPSLKQLPELLRGPVKIVWYEGSVFFAIVGILNYKWSQTGLLDIADKCIAGLLVSILVGAGLSYLRTGDKPTGLILTATGVLQAIGANKAAL